jgi:hypothetical protein
VPRGADVARTIAGDEVIASERVVDAIRAAQLTGVEFQPVESIGNALRPSRGLWFEVIVTGEPIAFASSSRFGVSVVDPENRAACEEGDTVGHALLSEAFLNRPSHELSDFQLTSQYLGERRGLLVPYRIMLISPRAELALSALKVKKTYVEVAHIID